MEELRCPMCGERVPEPNVTLLVRGTRRQRASCPTCGRLDFVREPDAHPPLDQWRPAA
jgi:hypothetical protein